MWVIFIWLQNANVVKRWSHFAVMHMLVPLTCPGSCDFIHFLLAGIFGDFEPNNLLQGALSAYAFEVWFRFRKELLEVKLLLSCLENWNHLTGFQLIYTANLLLLFNMGKMDQWQNFLLLISAFQTKSFYRYIMWFGCWVPFFIHVTSMIFLY